MTASEYDRLKADGKPVTLRCALCGEPYCGMLLPAHVPDGAKYGPCIALLPFCMCCLSNRKKSSIEEQVSEALLYYRLIEPEMGLVGARRCAVCGNLIFPEVADVLLHLESDPDANSIPAICHQCEAVAGRERDR